MSLQPGTLIGRYVVVRKLAEGGMAEIFLAAAQGPEGFEKEVVIKRIRSGFATDPAFIQMFVEEAKVVSRLNHANIVQIIDFARHEESYYLAMEYVRGRSLSEAHKRARELSVPLPPVLVAHLGQEVARGLAYAHRLSDGGRPLELVHRDVTPHNILLSYDGAVKLTDFGIAKASNRATTTGMLKGKFAYMSPEQARGERVDPRTDVFALGITLWELLTSGRLFDSESDVGVLRAVQEREVLAPSVLNPEVDEEMDRVILRALERDLSRRYQSAQEMERALAHVVLRTARSPDDTDLGAWMQELFPIEAKRAEPSFSRSTPVPPAPSRRPTPALVASAAEGIADPLAGLEPEVPPEAYSATASARTVLSAGTARDESSHRTPVTRTPVTQSPLKQKPPPSPPLAERLQQLRAAAMTWVAGHRVPAAVAAASVLLLLVVGVTWTMIRHSGSTGSTQVVSRESPRPDDLALTPGGEKKIEPPPPPPADTPPPPSTEPGTLSLTVIPWGAVYVDGKLVRAEHVGMHEYVLSPGTHRIQVKGQKPSEFDVEIRPGGRETRRVRVR
ncbi:MAG TPA: protein kinase [Myxococcaceae bacterium]|nr:protein kinase [Myxococcaceae bacterium]